VLENNQLLPFERNRYYVGKLLTSADFAAEQTYFNNKRRFLSSLMFGAGIVCGLGVFNLDDQSIMVESGVAVDGYGREIVLEGSVVKKLSAVEGFEGLSGDRALLCLRYHEEPVHPVYSISRQEQGEEYELNRIREGYELFLTDAGQEEKTAPAGSDFICRERLYADSDFAVNLQFPTTVSCGGPVKLIVSVEKLSEADVALTMDCLLQTPAFTTDGGEHEIHITLDDLRLELGKTAVREYYLTAQDLAAPDSILIAKADMTTLHVGGAPRRLDDNRIYKIAVSDLPVQELIDRELGRVNLETRDINGREEYIPLAEFSLQRTKNAYIIDKVTEDGIKHYIHTAADEAKRREYESYFERPAAAPVTLSESSREAAQPRDIPEPVYASGVCEIPLDPNMRRGDIVLSDEIMHGLGKGNVYVQVGVEYLSDDQRLGVSAKNTIFGNPELFAHEKPPISYVETAVKVMNDRGSFLVAARLTRETNYVVLLLRWVAFKLPGGEDKGILQRMAGKSIDAVQPTVVLGTRESHYFNVRFKNMEPCTLIYELTEKDSGTITSDGVYTAPAKEGVYEIRISCADMPLICTYAYAIVKKKEAEQSADEASGEGAGKKETFLGL